MVLLRGPTCPKVLEPSDSPENGLLDPKFHPELEVVLYLFIYAVWCLLSTTLPQLPIFVSEGLANRWDRNGEV